jgi:adenylate cyclase
MKKALIPFLIGAFITFAFAGFAIIRLLPIERLETLLYDVRYQIRGKTAPPKEVAIVAIDDNSLEQVGRWPWDRRKVATVIDNISSLGGKVIMMDIILSESAPGDEVLAASIKKAGNVILPVVFDFKGDRKPVQDPILADNAISMVRGADNYKIFPPVSAKGVLLPLSDFSKAANCLAYINMFPDRDGVLRWETLALEYSGEMYPVIGLQAVRMYRGLPIEALTLKAAEGVQMGERFIPTDFWGRTLVHYYGPERTFSYIPIVDVLKKTVDPKLIKDKIVLVGATAVGIYDLRVTPTSPAMPGIEKHASVIGSILHDQYIHQTKNIINVLIVLVSGLIFSIVVVKIRAVLGAALALFFISVIFMMGYYFFFERFLWVNVSYPANNILAIYFIVTSYRYATEERYAKRIRHMFSSYVTERVVNELIKNPNLAKLGGDRREITVHFSDVRGFTTFSEHHSPEEVVAILNEYLGEMTNIVFHWDGTLDKFVGDEIVAFWGAPIPQENHALLGMKCTLHMLRRLQELHDKWVSEGRTPLMAGYGLNTGPVLVGNIGAEGKKMDYTVIGDNVNLGARVEGLTRMYDADIIITAATLEKLRPAIADGRLWRVKVTGLDLVAVKGKAEPVPIYKIETIPSGEESSITEVEAKEVVKMTKK